MDIRLELDDLPFPSALREVRADGTPGDYLAVNGEFLDLYELDEPPTRPDDLLGVAADGLDQIDRRVIRTGNPIDYDLRFRGRTLVLQKRPVRRDGEVVAVLTICTDQVAISDPAQASREVAKISEITKQAVSLLEVDPHGAGAERFRVVNRNRYAIAFEALLGKESSRHARLVRRDLAVSAMVSLDGVPDVRTISVGRRIYTLHSERVSDPDEAPAVVAQSLDDITDDVRASWHERLVAMSLVRDLDEAIAMAFRIGEYELGMDRGILAEVVDDEVVIRARTASIGEVDERVPVTPNVTASLHDPTVRMLRDHSITDTPVLDHVGMQSSATVPLVVDGAPWGLLVLGSSRRLERRLPEVAKDFVGALGGALSVLIERDLARTRLVPIEALQESNRRLEEYAHAAAHDLRSPLRRIRSFAQLLEAQVAQDPIDRERTQDFAHRIASGAEKLDVLLRSLLEHADLDHLRSEDEERVDLAEVVERVVEIHDAPGLTVHRGELPALRMPSVAAERIVSNLVDNAIKYAAPDRPPRIDITSETRPDGVRLRIADNGVGIPAEAREEIFRLFRRLDGSTEGSGVGLAMVRKLITDVGGSIQVESEFDYGSTFVIDLPSSVVVTDVPAADIVLPDEAIEIDLAGESETGERVDQ